MKSSRFLLQAVFGLCLSLLALGSSASAATSSYRFTAPGQNGTSFVGEVTLTVGDTPTYDAGTYRYYTPVSASATILNSSGGIVSQVTSGPNIEASVKVYRYVQGSTAYFYVELFGDNIYAYFYVYGDSLWLPNTDVPTGILSGYDVNQSYYYVWVEGSGFDGYGVSVISLSQDAYAQITALQTQLAAANAQVTSLQSQLAVANQDNANLSSELSSKVSQVAQLSADLSAAQAQVAALQTQLAAAQSSLATANQQIATLTASLTAAQGANAALTTDNSNLQASLAASQAQLAQTQASLASALTFNATLSTANATLTTELNSANAALTSANAANASLTTNLATANAAKATLAAQVTTLQANLASSQASTATLTANLAAQTAAAASTTAQLTSFVDVLRAEFSDSTFNIAGATNAAQLHTLSVAIGDLNHGQRQALYKNLGGTKK